MSRQWPTSPWVFLLSLGFANLLDSKHALWIAVCWVAFDLSCVCCIVESKQTCYRRHQTNSNMLAIWVQECGVGVFLKMTFPGLYVSAKTYFLCFRVKLWLRLGSGGKFTWWQIDCAIPSAPAIDCSEEKNVLWDIWNHRVTSYEE